MSADSYWQVDDNQATITVPTFSASIDMQFPEKGLYAVKYNGKAIGDISTLKISQQPTTPKGGETIIESYRRGDDLIVKYAQTPARSARPQLDWSLIELSGAVGIQATIAMQTSLLDSDPTVQARSVLGDGELLYQPSNAKEWHSSDGDASIGATALSLLLFRPTDADWSYAEVIYPSDFQGASVSKTTKGLEIEISLFPEFLEKGVIRKGRIQSLFMSRTNDQQIAVEAHNALAHSAAPLTT